MKLSHGLLTVVFCGASVAMELFAVSNAVHYSFAADEPKESKPTLEYADILDIEEAKLGGEDTEEFTLVIVDENELDPKYPLKGVQITGLNTDSTTYLRDLPTKTIKGAFETAQNNIDPLTGEVEITGIGLNGKPVFNAECSAVTEQDLQEQKLKCNTTWSIF